MTSNPDEHVLRTSASAATGIRWKRLMLHLPNTQSIPLPEVCVIFLHAGVFLLLWPAIIINICVCMVYVSELLLEVLNNS